MKAIIIGCGYVGSRVARLWHQAGIDLTVTTTTKTKAEELQKIASRVEIVTGNDLAALERIVADRDVVLLSVGSKESSPAGYQKAYLETASNLVKAIKNSQVTQLIYTSSYGILSGKDGEIVDETIAANPATEKGEIMHAAEKVLLGANNYNRTLNTCIFRLSGIYGEGRELIRIFMRRAGTTQPGTGSDYTNWVYVDDIVRAIDHARKQQLRGIYNLTSDEILTTKEFYHRLFEANKLPDITWDATLPPNRRKSLQLSNQKLKNTGFQFAHPQIEFK